MDSNKDEEAPNNQPCDEIDLNQFTKIQSYGAFLLLNKDLEVIQYSENITQLFPITIAELLSSPIISFLKLNAKSNQPKLVNKWLKNTQNEYRQFIWKGKDKNIPTWAFIRQETNLIILEIEPAYDLEFKNDILLNLTQDAINFMNGANKCTEIQQLLQLSCEKIQQLTGFDRVLAYVFDSEDLSGIVVAEALSDGVNSYSGLRFPATDIPKKVRENYKNLQLRYIPTIEEAPVDIKSVNKTIKNINLSCFNLRMVAPIHIDYLRNMNVKSATSIGLIQNNQLWGIIACHHQTPKQLLVSIRILLILLANSLSAQIAAIESNKDFQKEQINLELQGVLTTHAYQEDDLSNLLEKHYTKMLDLVQATGMSVCLNNNFQSFGKTPSSSQIADLINRITKHKKFPFVSNSLPKEFKSASNYKNKACGILALPLIISRKHYLIFYRPEKVTTIRWAGKPKKELKNQAGIYSPRNSFAQYRQTIANHAMSWKSAEIKAAEFVRSLIVNKQLQDLLHSQAIHDNLTGLLNRAYLQEQLTFEIKRAEREDKKLAVALIDLDHFKKINDTFGHPAGDSVLIKFSQLLKSFFRGYDYLYRYGGEEFLILLPSCDTETALKKLESLRVKFKQQLLKHNNKRLPSMTFSAGLSIYPENGSTPNKLILAADKALYEAKTQGRDKIIGFKS